MLLQTPSSIRANNKLMKNTIPILLFLLLHGSTMADPKVPDPINKQTKELPQEVTNPVPLLMGDGQEVGAIRQTIFQKHLKSALKSAKGKYVLVGVPDG